LDCSVNLLKGIRKNISEFHLLGFQNASDFSSDIVNVIIQIMLDFGHFQIEPVLIQLQIKLQEGLVKRFHQISKQTQ